MVINANGRVAAASVHRSSGHSDLDAAAIDAARQWTFRPAQRAGTAVSITVLKPFRFVLESR
jgi:protein TonB